LGFNYNKEPVDTRLLVERSRHNDLQAFEQLVQIYQNKVYGLCYQLTGNYNDSQDLAQEVFIKAYSSIKTFKNQSDFGTWLHRIAVNTWINIQRKRKRRQEVSIDAPLKTEDGEEMAREIPSPEANPLETVESKELNALVNKAIQQLSYEHRAVLVLREIEGYSYEEIAQIMDCSIGTVRSRINRARKAMKEQVLKLYREFGL
jgi:RNA polymerase sigma-70 factor (ECF subfamily)